MNSLVTSDFLKSYSITFKGMQRVYRVPLNDKKFGLESYRPQGLVINRIEIEESSWAKIIIRCFNYLWNKNKIADDVILSRSASWSKAPIFLKEPYSVAHLELENGLYINTNRTSTHLYWSLIEVLKLFSVDLKNCELFVRIPHNLEHYEVTEFIHQTNIKIFSNYLFKYKHFSDDKVNSILESINKIDEFVRQCNHRYIKLFLFDSRTELSRFKTKLLEYVKLKVQNSRHIIIIESILRLVTDFFLYYEKRIELIEVGFISK